MGTTVGISGELLETPTQAARDEGITLQQLAEEGLKEALECRGIVSESKEQPEYRGVAYTDAELAAKIREIAAHVRPASDVANGAPVDDDFLPVFSDDPDLSLKVEEILASTWPED